MIDETKYMFMICGVSGSGKSTLANKLLKASENQPYIRPIMGNCDFDDYWEKDENGNCIIDNSKIVAAYVWAMNKAKELMTNGDNLIISNPSLNPIQRLYFVKMAEDFGYRIIFIHLDGGFKNIHNIPEDNVQLMRRIYQDPNHHELKLIVRKSEMNDGLKTLLDSLNIEQTGEYM